MGRCELFSWQFTALVEHPTDNESKLTVPFIKGLRGLASLLVVTTHLARAFDPDLFLPASSENGVPRLLQRPFVRVFLQGRIGVSIFSLVTGYVCALKPIRQARSGNIEGALVGVAKSAFRRIPRIVLPTTIATCITWFLCQFGVFQVAKHTNSAWLSYTAPDMSPYITDAVRSLWFNVIETWVYGRNMYDPNHWNLQPLLRGSMLVYISVFATIYMQPKYRMMASLAQWVYYYIGSDCKLDSYHFHCFFD
jgi:peptidoglycan/LPS O-acetylase OafA/YrhL